MLKQIDIKFIRDLNPCYDPAKYLPENFKGTALDILQHQSIPDSDKLWVVLRTSFIDEKTLRLFAIDCAEKALAGLKDQSSDLVRIIKKTLKVSKKYALGQATEEERDAADSAAYSAAYSAADSAAYSAAYSAADSAAYSAARSAAYSAAYSAARSAAYSAADSAAYSAAYSAADSAAYSAVNSATYSAARSAQVKVLINMLDEFVAMRRPIYPECTNTLSGIKHDDGKPDMSLLSAVALDEVAKVMTFGKKKYAAHNWRGGFIWSRPLAAALRHTLAFLSGEDKDPETGLSHLAHAICCLMFVLEFTKTGAGQDDRYKGAPINGNDKK